MKNSASDVPIQPANTAVSEVNAKLRKMLLPKTIMLLLATIATPKSIHEENKTCLKNVSNLVTQSVRGKCGF